MINNIYDHDFYKNRHQKTVYSARTVISIVLNALPPVHSAIDFGCGVGTWLSVLKEEGVIEIQGLDGHWVEQTLLEIPKQNFREVDFEEAINFDKKFDLAITLEVAEHLSPKKAISFIDTLVAASDFILFSAAIPFQGGSSHINEQWPVYWADMFAKREYVALDCIRRRIWNDQQIPTWYRQNILLFVKKDQIHKVKLPGLDEYTNNFPISLVHPDLYLSKINQMSSTIKQMSSIKGSWNLLLRSLKNYVNEKIGKNN